MDIVTVAGILRGTMVVMAGTARGTIPGMHHGMIPGMIPGMIRGTILATMVIIRLGATVGTAATTIVHGATIVGILLFIIMAVVAIGRQLTTVSTPIVM